VFVGIAVALKISKSRKLYIVISKDTSKVN
jgi:hypothetical protein